MPGVLSSPGRGRAPRGGSARAPPPERGAPSHSRLGCAQAQTA